MNQHIKYVSSLALIGSAMLLTAGCESKVESAAEAVGDEVADVAEQVVEAAKPAKKKEAKVVTELLIENVQPGDGEEAVAGKTVVVHYTGWLYDPAQPGNKGQKFDSSIDRGEPFQFELGAGRVIRGWDEGVAGMKVGGERILTIPSDMAYGDRGVGAIIKPNSTLLFEVKLLGIK